MGTSCTNLVIFGAVPSEKRLLIFVLFEKNAKMGISADYLRKHLINLDQLFSFDRNKGGDNLSDVRFEIAQGTLPW